MHLLSVAQKIKEAISKEVEEYDESREIHFLCLVGSDAGDFEGYGIPRNAHYIFDVKSEIELERHKIKFLSCQDLLEFYKKETGTNGEGVNVYELALFYIERHPNGYFFLDEVPLMKEGSYHRLLLALY